MFSPYLGKRYSMDEVMEAAACHRDKIISTPCSNKYIQAAKSISNGKIIGWFQGKSECGPRALGNRSILADPRNPEMKDILNSRVKFREFFRPFAPAVLYEHQMEYFDLDIPSPYMLMVSDIWQSKREVIPAVTHVDGTGRIQSVLKELNSEFYELINNFYTITGVPIVLNTSFNINKEPIVETPLDAINCFLISDFDELYIEDMLIVKTRQL